MGTTVYTCGCMMMESMFGDHEIIAATPCEGHEPRCQARILPLRALQIALAVGVDVGDRLAVVQGEVDAELERRAGMEAGGRAHMQEVAELEQELGDLNLDINEAIHERIKDEHGTE